MKIQIVTHSKKENIESLVGRWSILPHQFKKRGLIIDHVSKDKWVNFFKRYLDFGPDAIITAGPIGSCVGLLRKIGLVRCPVIHDWNDNYPEIMGKKWGRLTVNIMEYLSVKFSDFIVTPSKYRLSKAISMGKKAKYIPHGINKEFFSGSKPSLLEGEECKKLIYIGEISRGKRTDALIESMRGSSAKLFLIGKYADDLKTERLPKNVIFLGYKKREDIPGLLRAADALIVTENNDSALKLFEYLYSGVKIIAPEGRISDYNDFGGILFYEKFSEIPKLLEVNAGKNRTKIYSWREISAMYIRFVREILDG